MGRIEHKNTFEFGVGKLICPNGEVFELRNVEITITTEHQELWTSTDPRQRIHSSRALFTTLQVKDQDHGSDQVGQDEEQSARPEARTQED